MDVSDRHLCSMEPSTSNNKNGYRQKDFEDPHESDLHAYEHDILLQSDSPKIGIKHRILCLLVYLRCDIFDSFIANEFIRTMAKGP